MPSPSSLDPPGPTYRFVVALYVTVLIVGSGAATLAGVGVPVRTGAVAVLLGGLSVLAVVGAVVGLVGLPRVLHPGRLYASGLSWLPTALGIFTAAVVLAVLLGTDAAAVGPSLLAVATGVGLAVVGGGLRLLARNAECRGRLAEHEVSASWRARPAPSRRRIYFVTSGLVLGGLGVSMVVTWEPSLVGWLGLGIIPATHGANEYRY